MAKKDPYKGFRWSGSTKFDGDDLTKKLREELPEHQRQLGYKTMEAYFEYMMKHKTDANGNVTSWEMSRADAEKLVNEHIMPRLRRGVMERYLLAKRAKYDPGMFNQQAFDRLVAEVTGVSAPALIDQIAETKLTHDKVANLAGRVSENVGSRFTEDYFAPLQDKAQLKKARAYIAKGFGKIGYKLKSPDEIDARTAAGMLQRIATGTHAVPDYLDDMKKYLKKK
ncbi:hypothetical protein D6745_01725 [Candidatus Woesearchaeota archaeon]|nr:MAG: hypothetical protein D6745_01725 [Candidatus Woesearchaeota archaeon]